MVKVTNLLSLHGRALLLNSVLHALLAPAIKTHRHALPTPLLLIGLVRSNVRRIRASLHE
jgi:hypothetical protein